MGVPTQREEVHAEAVSLGDAVFRSVSDAIVDGTLASGEQLRPNDLEHWLGVSRTPIRDALARLAALGLVESQPGRYTRVTRFSGVLAAESREYTGFLVGTAVRMAVARMSDDQFLVAVRLLDRLVAADGAGDDESVFATHRKFTDHMCERTGNRLFTSLTAELGPLVERTLRYDRARHRTRSDRSPYIRLRDAVANRDPDYAEYAFRVIHRLTAEFDDIDGSGSRSAAVAPADRTKGSS